jgi:CubicO group peptidase (beta-lactamase class C family)
LSAASGQTVTVTDVRTLLAEAAGRRGLGGVGVAVVRSGAAPEFTCDGLAGRGPDTAVSPQTVFRIASITKTMTAIGLLQLRDRGLLGLDDPVNDHLQGLRLVPPPGGPPVTFRHLLTHTAGIGEMPRVSSFFKLAFWGGSRAGAAPADVVALYGGQLRTEVPAGAKWAYSNHAFVVLGKLVEDISGVPLDRYMHDHLFAPLGMDHTAYRRTDAIAPRMATGHQWLLGRFRPVRDYDMTLLGAGAVLAPLEDMARYADWLLRGGSDDVLAPATLAEMTSPHYRIAPALPGMGLAFPLSQCGPHRVFGHDGNMPDFASVLLVAPEAGVSVVALTNTGTVLGANLLASAVLRQVLDLPDPASVLPSTAVVDPPQSWAGLSGCYAPAPGFLTNVRPWQMLGGEAQVVVRHRHLVLRALSPALWRGVRLHRADRSDPSRYAYVVQGEVVPVIFEGAGAGRAERVVIGSPVNAVLFRRPRWRSSRLHLQVAALASALALWRRRAWRARRAQAGGAVSSSPGRTA